MMSTPCALANFQQGVHIGGMTVEMDRDDRLGSFGDQRFDRRGINAERIGVDIGQNRRRAGVGDRVRRRNEGQIGNDHLIARLQSQRRQREVKAGRAVAHGKGIFGSAIAREACLELIDVFSDRRYPSGIQRIQHELLFARANERFRNRDESCLTSSAF